MFDDPLVKIKDMNKMAKGIGKDVARNMNIPLDEFKAYIKPKEIKSIIKQYCIEKEDDYLINTVILKKIFSTVNSWAVGIQMSKLAGENKIEVYWDGDQNCAVFKNKE